MAVTHAFVSAKADGGDATLVRPSDWNASHVGDISTFAALTDVEIVRKTADETVNNSSTLQNDDALLFAIGANEVWEFTLVGNILGTSTSNFKFTFTIPSGASGVLTWKGSAGTGSARNGGGAITTNFTPALPDAAAGLEITAVAINGANAGNVQFQWAQSTATAENTQVLTNSFIIAHKIA